MVMLILLNQFLQNVQVGEYAIVSNKNVNVGFARNILIEQFQSEPPHTVIQKYDKNNHTTHIVKKDIRFSFAVKALFFALKNITNTSVHCNYSTGIPVLTGINEDVCTTSDYSFWEKGWEETNETTILNTLGSPEPLFKRLSYIKSIKIGPRSIKNGDTIRVDDDWDITGSKIKILMFNFNIQNYIDHGVLVLM